MSKQGTKVRKEVGNFLKNLPKRRKEYSTLLGTIVTALSLTGIVLKPEFMVAIDFLRIFTQPDSAAVLGSIGGLLIGTTTKDEEEK